VSGPLVMAPLMPGPCCSNGFLLKADRSGAVLVLEVSDAAAARAAVDSLPLVQHGVTRFDLTELMEVPTHVA
jgi:hypothetical protein